MEPAFSAGSGCSANALEAIVAVIAGIALASVAGGEQNVGHLARGDEVQSFFSVGGAVDQRSKKLAEAIADNGISPGSDSCCGKTV